MIKLTVHVQTRIQQRQIAMAWIEAAINAPDRMAADKDSALTNSFKSIPEFGGRILKVVHRAIGSDVLVITAYFDRGAKP